MIIFRFDPATSRLIQQHGSQKASATPVALTKAPALIHCIYLESGGVLGLHPATSNQLFLVVQGQGRVRSEDSQETTVHTGQAVFWQAGELHETRCEKDMVALVIEAEDLQPSMALPIIKVKGP